MILRRATFERDFACTSAILFAAVSLALTALVGIDLAAVLAFAFGAMYARRAVIFQHRIDAIFARALAVALAEGEMPELRQAA